jgi:hypothetical protein
MAPVNDLAADEEVEVAVLDLDHALPDRHRWSAPISLALGSGIELTHIDRASGEPTRRYEHEAPGDTIHVDV